MRLNAENVLDDCKRAFELLENVNSDEQLFRIYWLTELALLSTVGEILYKIDCEENEKVKLIWSNRFKELKENKDEHKIFWSFIKEERNNIIHEYKVSYSEDGAHRVSVASNSVAFYVPESFFGDAGDNLKDELASYTLDSNIYRPMDCADAWGSIDCRDLIEKAIFWWENEIGTIKQKLGSV